MNDYVPIVQLFQFIANEYIFFYICMMHGKLSITLEDNSLFKHTRRQKHIDSHCNQIFIYILFQNLHSIKSI